ncbi:MAG: hypothetical protein ACXVPN_11890 [Bacteroidia bacterium]
MKPVVTFYTACLITLYSVLTFIGYRKEKVGNAKEGILPEVVVSAAPVKTDESEILGTHFNNVLFSLEKRQKNLAADQLYDALMVFTLRGVSSGDYDKDQFWKIVNSLRGYYVDLKLKRPAKASSIKKAFESAELYIAKELLLRSSSDVEKNEFQKAVEDVKKAEECIAIAARYSPASDMETEESIINGSSNLMGNIIKTRRENSPTAYLKRFWRKIDDVEGKAI